MVIAHRRTNACAIVFVCSGATICESIVMSISVATECNGPTSPPRARSSASARVARPATPDPGHAVRFDAIGVRTSSRRRVGWRATTSRAAGVPSSTCHARIEMTASAASSMFAAPAGDEYGAHAELIEQRAHATIDEAV